MPVSVIMLVLTLLAIHTDFAVAATWRSFWSNSSGQFFYDTESISGAIEDKKLSVKVNVINEPRDGAKSRFIGYSVNCIDQTYSLTTVKTYTQSDLNGNEITAVSLPNDRYKPQPNSLGAQYVYLACNTNAQTGDLASNQRAGAPSTAAVVERQRAQAVEQPPLEIAKQEQERLERQRLADERKVVEDQRRLQQQEKEKNEKCCRSIFFKHSQAGDAQRWVGDPIISIHYLKSLSGTHKRSLFSEDGLIQVMLDISPNGIASLRFSREIINLPKIIWGTWQSNNGKVFISFENKWFFQAEVLSRLFRNPNERYPKAPLSLFLQSSSAPFFLTGEYSEGGEMHFDSDKRVNVDASRYQNPSNVLPQEYERRVAEEQKRQQQLEIAKREQVEKDRLEQQRIAEEGKAAEEKRRRDFMNSPEGKRQMLVAEAERRRSEQQMSVKIAGLKIKGVGLGLNQTPCRAEDSKYVGIVGNAVRLQYECKFGPSNDQTLVIFASDRKAVVAVIRRQYLKPSDPDPSDYLAAAIKFYGTPTERDEGNWMAMYGDPFSLQYSGRSLDVKSNPNGVGFLIRGRVCANGMYGTEVCDGLGTKVIVYQLINQAALTKSIEDGKLRLQAQMKNQVQNQAF